MEIPPRDNVVDLGAHRRKKEKPPTSSEILTQIHQRLRGMPEGSPTVQAFDNILDILRASHAARGELLDLRLNTNSIREARSAANDFANKATFSDNRRATDDDYRDEFGVLGPLVDTYLDTYILEKNPNPQGSTLEELLAIGELQKLSPSHQEEE